eukprot:5779400-Pyramimonas_sp.AAC.1
MATHVAHRAPPLACASPSKEGGPHLRGPSVLLWRRPSLSKCTRSPACAHGYPYSHPWHQPATTRLRNRRAVLGQGARGSHKTSCSSCIGLPCRALRHGN